jgi:adenylate cyclase
MSQAITAHHGFVDKFLGDAILAVFDRTAYHASDALDGAVAMLRNLSEFNRDRAQYNLDRPLNVGIGIHTGLGLIGTLGSDNRMDSTVIGDVVNTAARLEELTKLYGCPILVSGTTLTHIQPSSKTANLATQSDNGLSSPLPLTPYQSRWVDRVTPRGKRIVLELYEILGTPTDWLDRAKLQSLSCYNAGIQAWFQEEYARALDYFQQVVDQNPDDTVAKLYVERCQSKMGLTPQHSH